MVQLAASTLETTMQVKVRRLFAILALSVVGLTLSVQSAWSAFEIDREFIQTCLESSCDSRVPGRTSANYSASQLTSFRAFPVSPFGSLALTPDGNVYGTASGGDFGFGSVYRLNTEGELNIVHSFSVPEFGLGLVRAKDGNLYGTLYGNPGSVFKISAAGEYSVVHALDGGFLFGALTEAPNGKFYGAANLSNGALASIYSVTPEGQFQIVQNFNRPRFTTAPTSTPTLGSDGFLYGITDGITEGTQGPSVMYRLATDGTLSVVTEFSGDVSPTPGEFIEASDGAFYGFTSTIYEFEGNALAVYRLSKSGELTIFSSFQESGYSNAKLVQAQDGGFFGVANFRSGRGPVFFRISKAGVIKELHTFSKSAEGTEPQSLVRAQDGTFYINMFSDERGGMTRGSVVHITPSGNVLSVTPFRNPDSERPISALTPGGDGKYYGVTEFGGQHSSGTIYALTLGGERSIVYSFDSSEFAFGFDGNVIRQSDGSFYGYAGSTMGQPYDEVVFRIDAAGVYTELARMNQAVFGGFDIVSLIMGRDGLLYGLTNEGEFGSVFQLSPAGELARLANFSGANGSLPRGDLIEVQRGVFYGVAAFGGLAAEQSGFGTVFRLGSDGSLSAVHSFSGTDGGRPSASLIVASDGNMYGTTSEGGLYGLGTVFRISPAGDFTSLHSFSGLDGRNPQAALVEGPRGTLSGTTLTGGVFGLGTVFQLPLGGNLSSVHSFGGNDGAIPLGLIADQSGKLLVTAYAAGPQGGGAILAIAPIEQGGSTAGGGDGGDGAGGGSTTPAALAFLMLLFCSRRFCGAIRYGAVGARSLA